MSIFTELDTVFWAVTKTSLCVQDSGLSIWMGSHLSFLMGLQQWLLVLLLCFLVCMATELISNPATCSILMPVVSAMVRSVILSTNKLMFLDMFV